jgi:methyltransferase
MRVLLIWPRNERAVLGDELSCCEPLPLEYLAGALRPHHDVAIHDLRLDPPLAQREDAPDVVGVAIPFTTSARAARAAARQAKELWPDAPVVLGGHHPTVSREWLDGFPADYVIRGEGGQLFKGLVDDIERGGAVRPAPGLARYGHASDGERPAHTDLNHLPLPDRSIVARHRRRYFHSIYNPVALVRFTAGCPYRCNFCSLWRMTDRRYLTKSVERVVRELEDIELENVYVVDDEAFIRPGRMLELADAIETAGIRKRYHMYVRTDTALRRADVIERWAEIGLDSVLVGAESMSDAELDSYEKGATSAQTAAAVRLFHELDVRVRANFIVQPTWLERDFARLAHSVAKLEIDIPSFSVLTPLPGTDLYDATRDRLISDNPELFDCYHTLFPTALPIERFYDSLATLLAETAGRRAPGLNGDGDPSVFYFSNDRAFDRMLELLRQGHVWNDDRWSLND